MPKRTERTHIALASCIYGISALCLLKISPIDPLVSGLRVGLLTLLTAVCIYAMALLIHGGFSKRVVCVGSFGPLTEKVIQGAASIICATVVTYAWCSFAPRHTDHHSFNGWTNFVNFQTKVIQRVEGNEAAQRFWDSCANHIGDIGAFFEQKHDYEKALEFYTEYKRLGDGAPLVAPFAEGVLGRICDELNDYKAADAHYDVLFPGVDENYKNTASVCQGKLLRILQFAPEEVVTSEFPWAEILIRERGKSAIVNGSSFIQIDFAELDDYQRELLRPVFHPEMLRAHTGEGYAPELEGTSLRRKHRHPTPVAGSLFCRLTVPGTTVIRDSK